MFEALVAATATTGLFALARVGRNEPYQVDPRLIVTTQDAEGDLPCPWCQASTSESDQRCPSCGHRFG